MKFPESQFSCYPVDTSAVEMGSGTVEDIKTFAVFDLETNGLPWEQFNSCSITELSIYAFSAKCLKDDTEDCNGVALQPNVGMEGIQNLTKKPPSAPELPRVLHKLTLMINPKRMIHPEAERITGLCNDMLCNESPFDQNTANCFLMFLERLEQPICFVAHNGWSFDFPVIRHVFEKIKMTVPSTIYCIDSLKAFIEIDEKQIQIENVHKTLITQKDECKISTESSSSGKISTVDLTDLLEANTVINWQKANETTPHRKNKAEKRKRDNETPSENPKKRLFGLSVRRELFSQPFQPKSKYPPKGKYQLGNIYDRVFKQPCENLHRAESDVMILTKLILHYGLDFLAYAEERKLTFDQVPKLGKV